MYRLVHAIKNRESQEAIMKTVDLIIKSVTDFYNNVLQDENGRYRSWEHCYSFFCFARNTEHPDIEYLSLHLAFYLASWGMYRGSSFLLQKDYRIHIPVVKEILKKEYDCLVGIDCVAYRKQENQDALANIENFMNAYYDNIRSDVKTQKIKNEVSATLITKILMGTLGCVPAYDRYFINGIKKKKVATGNYNMKSILMLVDFYEQNVQKFEDIRRNMKVYDMPYPQMKMLDMGFWQIGFDADQAKGIKVAH